MKVGTALERIFLSLPNRRPPCLKCGQQAVASGNLGFFVSSCWLGCLSSALARFSAIPTFMRFYGIHEIKCATRTSRQKFKMWRITQSLVYFSLFYLQVPTLGRSPAHPTARSVLHFINTKDIIAFCSYPSSNITINTSYPH